jgi:putative cofactor-binding repeat protein
MSGIWTNLKLFIAGAGILMGMQGNAQVSTYTFSQTSGTYSPISGGTVLGAPTNDDTSFPTNPIGFTFWFNGVAYSTFSVNSNGFIALGGAVNSSYTAISTGISNNIIAALNADLQGEPTTGDLRYQTIGSFPNRTLVVQWSNYDRFSSTTNTDVYNFQIRLQETSNTVDVVYGSNSSTQVAALSQVGLRGNSSADFNNREVVNGVQTWSTSISGASNAASCEMNPTLAPASGQTYTWTPPAGPSAPTSISFTAVSQTGMTVNWIDNSTTEAQFFVERSLDNITFVPAGTVVSTSTTSTGTSYNLVQTGLLSNTLYYYRVYAVAVTPSGPLSGQQATLPGTLCGTFSVGPTGAYPSLTAAFAAVAANGVICPLVFDLQPAYVSTVETFPLTIPFLGNSTANTITVRPQLGATNLSISSNAVQTINFNGAQNIVFDGRPGSTGTIIQLTLANTSTFGAVVQVGGDAANIGLNYVNVRSVNTGTTIGAVQYTAPASITGSTGHYITNCDFANGATNPQQYVFSSNTLANSYISSVTISNNRFRDWFNATSQNAAVNLGGNIRDWTISNNSFYQTATRTFTAGATHYGILISGSTAGSGGHNISGNFIGGTAPNCGGTPWTIAGTIANRFVAISVNGNSTGNPNATSMQGNTITNFNLTTSSGATTSPGIFCGIQALGTTHNLNIGNVSPNIIGSVTTANAITTSSSTAGGLVMGIVNTSNGAVVINNNLIGGFTVNTSSPTISSSFTGIQTGTAVPGTISNNIVGSTTVPNSIITAASTATTAGVVMGINSTSGNFINITNNTVMNLTNQYAGTSTTAVVRGIYSSAGVTTITGNTVRNLSSLAPNTNTGINASVQGISLGTFTIGSHVVNNNIVNTLANGSSSGNVMVSGITVLGSTSTLLNATVAYNNISALGAPLTSGTATIYGINLIGNPSRVFNNFVNLGSDITGSPITVPNSFIGINKETTAPSAVNFNTVNISGSGVNGGAVNTMAYRRVTTAADTLINNILVNTRSNGTSTGTHYSLNLNNGTTFISNNNDYFGNGVGYQTAVVNSVNVTGVSGLVLSIGGNGNSIAVNPNFISSTDLHINNTIVTALESRAATVAYVANDIDGQVRPGPTALNGGGTAPDMGADEFDGIPLSVDVGAFSFLQPATPGCYSPTQTIRVRVRNYANSPLNMASPGNAVTITVNVTGPNPQTFSMPPITSGTIPGNGFLDTTVTTSYNMGATGTYGFSATATTSVEVLTLNDAFGPLNIVVAGGTAVASGGGRICLGDQGTVVVSGFTNGGTIQWQESPDNIVWSNIPAATNDTLVIIPTDTTFYRADICGQHLSVSDTLFPQFVAPPVTTNDTICGLDTAFLSATAAGSIRWYNQPIGGLQLATGSTYSPILSATDTFYVTNATGTPPTTVTTTFAAGNGSSGNVFRISAINTITITGFDGHMTSGTANWEIWGRPGDYTLIPGSTASNAGWTLLGSASGVVAAGLGVPTPLPITLNVTIPGGTDYSFVVTTTGPTVNYTNGTLLNAPFVSNSDLIFIQGHGGAYFNYSFSPRVFNGRIHYSSGCESARVPAIVVVNPPPAISASSSNTICGSGSTTLTVASPNSNYNFTWSPSTALSATTGDTVVATPGNTINYVVSAIDPATQCATTDTIQAIVAPAVVGTATVSDDTICGNTQVQLDINYPPATFAIGTQNVQNTSTTYPSPFGQFWWGAKHQMLITAAELQATGMTAGFYNALAFELPPGANTPAPSPALQNFELRIANTSLTAMTTAFQTTGFTSLFTNAALNPTTGTMTLAFNNNWYWDGVSNIIVETCFNNNAFTLNWVFRQSTTAYASTAVRNEDATGVCAQAVAFSTFNQRPNMIFTRSSGSSAYAWTGITDTLSGCNFTDTVSVNVLPTPAPSFGPDTIICSTSPLVLDGTAGPYTYLWQDNSSNQTFSVSSFGIYNVLVTDTTSGCTGTDTILVGVNPAPVFTLGSDAAVCAGSNVTFSGPGGPYDYDWNTGDSVIAVTVNTTGSYILVVTDQNNGCSAADTVVFTANPLPVVTLGADTSYCSNNAIVLNGPAGNFTYVWSDNSTNDSLSVSSTGTYFVTVTDTATTCFNADTVTIIINATPVVALGADTTFCSSNGPLTLNAPAGPYNYLWSDNSNGTSLAVNTSGTYAVAVTDSLNGCSSNDSINVVVNASPNAVLADTSSCGNGITLTAAGGNYTYVWSDNTTGQSTTVTISGNVSVVVTDTANGCAITDGAIVNINTPPTATVTASAANVCADDANVTLTGAPAGGVFVGTSVTGNAFDPSVGAGSYAVDYIYTDANGCTDTATTTIVVSACVGVEEAFFGVGMNVYPNPNNGQFIFTCSDANFATMTFEVISMDGKVVLAEQASNVQGQYRRDMNMYNLANGVYYFRVIADGQTYMQKIVKQD